MDFATIMQANLDLWQLHLPMYDRRAFGRKR
jgi:hypothetical protein